MGSTRGLRVPHAYVRRAVARSWGVSPMDVDQAPIDELNTELRIMHLEAEATNLYG